LPVPPATSGSGPLVAEPSGPTRPPAYGEAPVVASATSARASQGANVFTADRALDRRPDTAWCEGGPDAGIGETLTLRFAQPTRVARLRVLPGYFKSPNRWSQNNRVAAARLVLSDGRAISATFEDEMREQAVPIGGGPVDSISFVIERVWSGGDGLDTLVSEIAAEIE
jgi:hypothetical protein